MDRHKYTSTILSDNGKVYNTTLLPSIPLEDTDIYIEVKEGDRMDNLAYKYYKDVSLWWVIALANDILVLSPGKKIRIPQYTTSIISALEKSQESR